MTTQQAEELAQAVHDLSQHDSHIEAHLQTQNKGPGNTV